MDAKSSKKAAEPWLDLASRGLKWARKNVDADRALQASMAGLIELAASRYALDQGEEWRPGKPRRLLWSCLCSRRCSVSSVIRTVSSAI